MILSVYRTSVLGTDCFKRGHDSSVGIATRYWLDNTRPTGPEDHPASYTMGTGSFLGLKRS
jgi:hypothetical protein